MPIEGAEVLSGEHIRGASAKLGPTSEFGNEGYYVELRLTKDGQKAFYEATQRNVGEPIYMMLDGEVICAPTVSQAINDDTCVISGDFTQEEAKSLAANIKSGQLPFKLTVREILPISEFYDE